MVAGQLWLFPPSKPLIERLSEDFFRALPIRRERADQGKCEVRIPKSSQFDNRKLPFVISLTPGCFNSMTTSGRPLMKPTNGTATA